ncbi:MAG: adenosylmethionine decarboxylase [Pirellulales bacterium]
MNQKTNSQEVGRNLLVDLSGIQPSLLRDADRLMHCLQASLANAGFRVLREVVHRFESGGEGITGIMILSESHAAVHTYPEIGYLALDIFSCGTSDSVAVADAMIAYLRPQHIDIHQRARSVMSSHPTRAQSPLASRSNP